MPFISRIQRQSDYSTFHSSHPIVIDNGGSYFRIGWAGESEPLVIFRNIIQRPRHKITEAPQFHPLTKEDFQIILGVERFRCPEILFHPNLIGIDQAGLAEMAGASIRRLPLKGQGLEERMTNSIFLTGGSSLFPGLSERLEAGIRTIQPCGTLIKIVKALDPIYDAWRGAAAYASALPFSQQTFRMMDYYEKGEDWLRSYKLRYTI